MNATKQDPRSNNIWFDSSSMSAYFDDYKKNLKNALDSIPLTSLERALVLMRQVSAKDGTFFVAGNGGSAGVANHLCCDWTKGTFVSGKARLKTHSLCSNTALMTALSNDMGDRDVFSAQFRMLSDAKDALIVISSSGNSPNIVAVLEEAKSKGCPTLSFTGFSGGKAKELADVNIHVDFKNYAIVEDAHQSSMQALAQFFFAAGKSVS